jgi:ribosomal protein L11 methyltransferase
VRVSEQSPEYTEVTLVTHPEAVEGLTDILLGLGASGVVVERRPLNLVVTAYLPRQDSMEASVRAIRDRLRALEKQGLRIGPGTIGLRTLGAEAWSEAWKDHFKVQRIAPSLVIAPSWEQYEPRPGEAVVVLDPGTAFGTGGHPTTRLCLRGLVEHIRPGDRVADVGCGSGILAVTAAVLGAREVIATDSDASALSVALTNARRNQVDEQIRVLKSDLLPQDLGWFDLIVSNITATEIGRLAERLPSSLAPNGRFIASGFLKTSVPMIEDALARSGIALIATPSEEGWAACIAVRPSRRR